MKSIRQKSVDLSRIKLSPEEGFVLSRVDGNATVKELVALTGLEESRVVDIIGRLCEEGAVEVDSDAPTGTVAGDREPSDIDDELLAFLRGDADSSTELSAPAAAGDDQRLVTEAEGDDGATETDEALAQHATNEREHRKIYESLFRAMSRDERVAAATEAPSAHLLALCLDAEPQVIQAVLANSLVTLECPRLIAIHHRTHVGLEHVAKRSDFLADAIVQRRLLRNPQLPGTILQRMLVPKPMMDVYKAAIDRELPERSRLMVREVLRKKFMMASSDERAALLFKTEGRCLVHLVNCSLDAHATQILCSKNTYTVLFIQNLARWSATPPALLGHLLKMQLVRHNAGLRKMLLKHPNTPSDLKRAH